MTIRKPIYLDYNGTTPIDPEVFKEMRPFLEEEFGNPSSSHYYGIKPRNAVENGRQQVANILNSLPQKIIFTSGGTESNNHAIYGAAMALKNKGNHIITSAIEHPAVLNVCRALKPFGFKTTYLSVNSEGVVNLDDLEKAILKETIIITIMHANNEVGTIQPISEICKIAKKYNIIVHTDAAQSIGKIPTDVDELGVDLLSIAGHKLYAPKGIGALYIRTPFRPAKFCYGAGQENSHRSGTENVPGIVALGKACEIARKELNHHMMEMKILRERLYHGIISVLPAARLNGHPDQRLPNTLSISFKGLEANQILAETKKELAISAGAACHADDLKISHVLQAMDVPLELAKGTLRFSVGKMTTRNQIDDTVEIITNTIKRLYRSIQ